MRSVEERFYKSKAWKNCRATFLQLNPLCEECLKRGLYVPATHAHHRQHLTEQNVDDPSVAYDFGNLEAVCLDCHNRIHFGRADRRYRYDDDGRLIVD